MKKDSLAIIAFFKNEAHILNEWILHHLSFGVTHFYLVDDDSSDSCREVLAPYGDQVTILQGKEYKEQRQAYQEAYILAKGKHDWVAILDLDEFLYIKNFNKNIPAYLATIKDDVEVLIIQWTLFLPTQVLQPKSVIQKSTVSVESDDTGLRPFKSCFRTSIDSENINIHRPISSQGKEVKWFRSAKGQLQLNHYRYQSYEFLLGVKSLRGGGVHKHSCRVDKLYKSIKQYMRLPIRQNNELVLLSENLINKLNNTHQIRPGVEIYTAHCWYKIRNCADDINPDLSCEELFNKVFSILGAGRWWFKFVCVIWSWQKYYLRNEVRR